VETHELVKVLMIAAQQHKADMPLSMLLVMAAEKIEHLDNYAHP